MNILDEIIKVARYSPNAIAVSVLAQDGTEKPTLTYSVLLNSAQSLGNVIARRSRPYEKVALIAENSPLWAIADLSLMITQRTQVPVPTAFSKEQAENIVAGITLFITDEAGSRKLREWMPQLDPNACIRLDESAIRIPAEDFVGLDGGDSGSDWICKIVHTSGTTGKPKGVRIRYHGISTLVRSLKSCIPVEHHYRRYLSLVPLSLLIEQVTALYLPLTSGGRVIFLPAGAAHLGVSRNPAKQYLQIIKSAKPTALTLTPALAEAIAQEVYAVEGDHCPLPESVFGQAKVPFMACGGAPTDPLLIKRLHYKGVTIYEGYGLSENSSVVSWNTPGNLSIGTAGKPLPHVELKLSENSELLVRSGSLCDGYEGLDPSSCSIDADGWLHTGDIAEIDSHGYVKIIGRIKNVIITSNARNVSPEWVESKYRTLNFVHSVALFGDGLEDLHGLFVVDDGTDEARAEEEIRRFGLQQLSDIERAEKIHFIRSNDESYAKFFTITGRPMRAQIQQAYSKMEECINE